MEQANSFSTTPVIRRARLTDAEAVTQVHFQGWREAYTGLVPESAFVAREAQRDERVQRWREIIAGTSTLGNDATYVALIDNRVVGWATAGTGRDDDPPFPNELNGLYVLAEAYGTGAGRGLLEAAVGATGGAYLWMIDAETRAASFYRKMGFVPDGTRRTLDYPDFSLPERRLVRAPN